MGTPYLSGLPRVRPYSSFYYGDNSIPLVRTLIEGTPPIAIGPRRVRLINYQTNALLREQWSNPVSGGVNFVNVPDGTYFVIAFDNTNTFAPVAEGPIVVPES